jgi:hypothetical protein
MSSSILFSLNWNQTGDLESEDLEYVLSALTKDAEGGSDELSFLLKRQTSRK